MLIVSFFVLLYYDRNSLRSVAEGARSRDRRSKSTVTVFTCPGNSDDRGLFDSVWFRLLPAFDPLTRAELGDEYFSPQAFRK